MDIERFKNTLMIHNSPVHRLRNRNVFSSIDITTCASVITTNSNGKTETVSKSKSKFHNKNIALIRASSSCINNEENIADATSNINIELNNTLDSTYNNENSSSHNIRSNTLEESTTSQDESNYIIEYDSESNSDDVVMNKS